jgi:hypothetical protein
LQYGGLKMNPNTQSDRSQIEKDLSLNDGLTAQPKNDASSETETAFDTENASVESARASGYTDAKGRAKDMAKPDKQGSPTGAYTDVGAGRSSAVTHKTLEKAPKVGEETAP